MIDLHLHSTCSDGTVEPADVVQTAFERGLIGLSLTDHNGVWGNEAAEAKAQELGLIFIQGIEISTAWQGSDIHILGYSLGFDVDQLTAGLATTRAGYEQRIKAMVDRCHVAGFPQVRWEAIQANRAYLTDPSYVTFDVTQQLQTAAGLSAEQARQLTVRGGACYVPYGEWALSPQQAIELLHQVGGLAVLAHPGIIAHESGEGQLQKILAHLLSNGLDGIEVWHSFHTENVIQQLQQFTAEHQLLKTAGSDWHGPDRFRDEDLGEFGLAETDWQQLQARLE